MKYPNGTEVKVGDNVRFERGGTTGTVETIIDTNFSDWSVDEPGVMLLSAAFGRVFIPVSVFVSEEVAPK
ncbi:MAG: hypothetical protein ACJ8R9_02455 [Steroidobacteraceae bacterium]